MVITTPSSQLRLVPYVRGACSDSQSSPRDRHFTTIMSQEQAEWRTDSSNSNEMTRDQAVTGTSQTFTAFPQLYIDYSVLRQTSIYSRIYNSSSKSIQSLAYPKDDSRHVFHRGHPNQEIRTTVDNRASLHLHRPLSAHHRNRRKHPPIHDSKFRSRSSSPLHPTPHNLSRHISPRGEEKNVRLPSAQLGSGFLQPNRDRGTSPSRSKTMDDHLHLHRATWMVCRSVNRHERYSMETDRPEKVPPEGI